MRVLMHSHRITFARGGADHDEIVIRAGLEERRGELIGPVGPILLFIAEGDDTRRAARGQAAAEGLQEEAPNLFEVAYEVAASAFVGRSVEFEVGRCNFEPGIVRGGRQADREGEAGERDPSHQAGRHARNWRAYSMDFEMHSSSSFNCASGLIPLVRGSGFFGWLSWTSLTIFAKSRPGSGL